MAAPRVLKVGCFGCLAVIGLAVLALLVVTGVSYMQVRSAEVETRELSRELTVVSGDAEADGDEAGAPAPQRVALELGHGEITIEPGEPGEPLRVEATFDVNVFALEEEYEDDGSGAPVYRVRFRETSSTGFSVLRALFGAPEPEVHVILPRDVPLAIEGRFTDGHADVELGGLWLTEVDLNLRKGAMTLFVTEPSPVPIERMRIDGKMGAVIAKRLGNGSPRELTINQSMGAAIVELDGAWSCDSDVNMELSMGSGQLRLPRNVTVRGLGGELGGFNVGPDPELPRPTLNMRVHYDMGEIRIVD